MCLLACRNVRESACSPSFPSIGRPVHHFTHTTTLLLMLLLLLVLVVLVPVLETYYIYIATSSTTIAN